MLRYPTIPEVIAYIHEQTGMSRRHMQRAGRDYERMYARNMAIVMCRDLADAGWPRRGRTFRLHPSTVREIHNPFVENRLYTEKPPETWPEEVVERGRKLRLKGYSWDEIGRGLKRDSTQARYRINATIDRRERRIIKLVVASRKRRRLSQQSRAHSAGWPKLDGDMYAKLREKGAVFPTVKVRDGGGAKRILEARAAGRLTDQDTEICLNALGLKGA